MLIFLDFDYLLDLLFHTTPTLPQSTTTKNIGDVTKQNNVKRHGF